MPDLGLVVCSTFSLPPTSGGRKRALRLLEAIERAGCRPHVLAIEAEGDSAAAARDRGWGIDVIARSPPRPTARFGQYARMEPEPHHPRLAARIGELAPQAAFVELEEIQQAQLIRAVPDGTPAIASLHNVDSALTRELARSRPARSREAARLHVRALRMAAVERRAVRRAVATIVVSEPDVAAFRALGAQQVLLAPNGIDDELFALPDAEVAAERVLFFGAYWWAPNREGLERFLREGWTRVRAARPQAHLRVVGPGPLDVVRRAADGLEGVEVVGVVDDIAAELAAARLSIVPLWAGGGTRIKVLESMAAALPVVSTSVGVEHLGFRSGVHGVLAEDPEGLATAAVELLADPARAAALGRRARADAQDRRWTSTTQPAEALYRALREGRTRA